MSAYVVDDETINRVVTHLDNDDRARWNLEQIREALGTATVQPEALGLAMFKLNVEAVGQRYPDLKSIEDMPGEIGHYEYAHRIELCGRVQALKSLECWLYQCSEGNVPERPLFQAMQSMAHSLAMDIVASTPEYERAKWG